MSRAASAVAALSRLRASGPVARAGRGAQSPPPAAPCAHPPPGPGMAGVWVWPPGRLVSPVPTRPAPEWSADPLACATARPSMSLGPRSSPTGAPSAAPAARPRTRAAGTRSPRRAARRGLGRTSQGTGTVPAPCPGQSVLGTARRAWVPDCQTPGWRQVRSRASRAPQGTPHLGQGTAWPRLLATLTWC